MKIVYLPLDERPCNYIYPQMIADIRSNVELIAPPREMLGTKKTPADTDKLWEWLQTAVVGADKLVVSLEQLVYGGLLPSRLHHERVETLLARLGRLEAIKSINSDIEILAACLIMRTPTYSSSEEEPDYYQEFGNDIFRWGWLNDKTEREGLSAAETSELGQIIARLPKEPLDDYCERRRKNIEINKAAIGLTDSGVIDFLSIPQDDSAPYGFTAIDQKTIVSEVVGRRLQPRVHMYPGADEVGCTLLVRCIAYKYRPLKIFPFYSAVNAANVIALYEDRPLGECLKAHILAAGCLVADSPEQADIILAINAPGKFMMESASQFAKDITYSSYRNLREFVMRISDYVADGYQVAVADVAFCNGGDHELVQMLDDAGMLDEITAYAGWNTNCNTTGTVIATAIFAYEDSRGKEIVRNKIYHLLEGWAYQGVIRQEMIVDFLPQYGASYFVMNGFDEEINRETEHRLERFWYANIRNSFIDWEIERLTVWRPWRRMFEIGVKFDLFYKKY
ncbi:MAG: DUF4127 family protein [Negativicutes bacterium]|jgi:hypothetical protein